MVVGVLGGGAAGFFAAIQLAMNSRIEVHILERTEHLLAKVRISGGGRCNVTHKLQDIQEFSKNYPRGHKELFFLFHRFNSLDMENWFREQNILLKTEKDGRMFPVTDSSETIIDCFLSLAQKSNVQIHTSILVTGIRLMIDGKLSLDYSNEKVSSVPTEFDKLIIATGSNRKVWKWLEEMGHRIVSPVPSLFTFNITDTRLIGLSGISFPSVKIQLLSSKLKSQGPLLITHWGMSGPAVLRLSSLGAVELYESDYSRDIRINFLGIEIKESIEALLLMKSLSSKKNITLNPFSRNIPNRYWEKLLNKYSIPPDKKWAHLTKSELNNLAVELTEAKFHIEGKGEFKDEFVTAGGVNRKDINFETMESKIVPGLYFAGEVIDVDGITGGFNFQNAWTTAWVATRGIINLE